MSGRKGMLHYKVETKKEAVRGGTPVYAAVAVLLDIRKAERIEA